MSLLLDALKRAEQEKLARQGDRPETGTGADAPTSHAPVAPAPKAAPSLELQPLGGGTAAANQSSLSGRGDAPSSAAQTAQAVFQAKTARDDAKANRGMLWATIGAIAVVVIAAGAYVYYSIQSLSPKAVPVARVRPAPVPPPASGSIPHQPPLPAMAMPPAAPVPAPAAGAPADVRIVEPPRKPATSTPESPQDVVAGLLREAAPDSPPLRLQRSPDTVRIPAEVSAGYEALAAGQLAAARRSYETAVRSDPMNIDARLGLATVEARSGNRTAAVRHYRQALEIDPRNATALAALAALSDFSRPEALEVQLRDDLFRHPDSAPLHFALGNVYASQRRWREAQAAFYEAHRLDPAGADILYNLAVTLDQLAQPRLAAEFYARALDAARAQPAQFDPASAARRLAELR